MQEFKKKIVKEFKEEWSQKKFKYFLFSSIALLIFIIFFSVRYYLYNIITGNYFGLFILINFIISSLIYNRFNHNVWSKQNSYQKGYYYFTIGQMIIYTIIYQLLMGNFIQNLSLVIMGFIVSFVIALIWIFYSLMSPYTNNLWILIPHYILLALSLIVLFAIVFMGTNLIWVDNYLSEGHSENQLFCKTNDIINESDIILNCSKTERNNSSLKTWDYLYFSSVTFYTLGYGDINPVGNKMRFFSQIEVIFAFILHGIIISYILSRRQEKLTHKNKN